MNSPPAFRLSLLGSACLARDDGNLVRGPAVQRHRLALLALLSLWRGRGASREKLLAYLWPENDIEHGRQLLNQAVYNVRKALGERALLSEGDCLRLNGEAVRVDVIEFETAIERGEHERAIALHCGPFLDGFFLNDAPEFDQWVERERERIARAFAGALEALARQAEEVRDQAGAVEWWKARAAHDPFDSRVALRLMHALDSGGNRAGALQHAASHQRLLREEFGVDSVPEVAALSDELRRDTVETAHSEREPRSPAAPIPSGGNPPAAPPHDIVPARLSSPAAVSASRTGAGLRAGVVATVLAAAVFGPMKPDAPREASIAVLPLANLSSGPGGAALADAMTEELITILATTGLRVIASTSVFAFKGRPIDVRTIADSLGVDHVLEGNVQNSGSRLRVQVRLVDVRDGVTRWSATYGGELQDIFAVQDAIVRAVADKLGRRVGTGSNALLRRQPTESVAAYELYLRGSDRTLLRSDSAAREGVEYFRRAIALDPDYAAAWAGLAKMYSRVAVSASMPERQRYLELAESAAERSVALDESLAEAHATLGMHRMAGFDFAAAERHLTRAIELDPAAAVVHEWMVTLFLWKGQPDRALEHARRALDLDPLSPYAHAESARALIGNDRCDEALAALEKLASLRPPLLRVAPMAALCYARRAEWTQAISVLRPQAEAEPTSLAALGYLLARSGQKEEAVRIQSVLLENWRQGGGAYPVALVTIGLGDFDESFLWLDRSVADRSLIALPGDHAHLMILEPLLHDLHRDPRFERLRKRLGLSARLAEAA